MHSMVTVLSVRQPPDGWHAGNLVPDTDIFACYNGPLHENVSLVDTDGAVYYINDVGRFNPVQYSIIRGGEEWHISLHDCMFVFRSDSGRTISSRPYPKIRHLSGKLMIVQYSRDTVTVATDRMWAQLALHFCPNSNEVASLSK